MKSFDWTDKENEKFIEKFTDVVTDPRFRLLGFFVKDLRQVRFILNCLDIDIRGLAERFGLGEKLP